MLGNQPNKTYDTRSKVNIFDPNPSFYELYTPFTPSPNAVKFSSIMLNDPAPNPANDIDKRLNNLNLNKFSDNYNIETLLNTNTKEMPIQELLMDQASFALSKYAFDRDLNMKLQLAYLIADYVYIYFGRDQLENVVLTMMNLKDKNNKQGELDSAMLVKLLVEMLTLGALTNLAQKIVGGDEGLMDIFKYVGGGFVINYAYEYFVAPKQE